MTPKLDAPRITLFSSPGVVNPVLNRPGPALWAPAVSNTCSSFRCSDAAGPPKSVTRIMYDHILACSAPTGYNAACQSHWAWSGFDNYLFTSLIENIMYNNQYILHLTYLSSNLYQEYKILMKTDNYA